MSAPRGLQLPGRPAVAGRLEAALATGASATLMLVDVDGLQDVRTAYGDAARRLAAAWSAPFRVGGEEVYVSASVGVATGSVTADELLRQADAALDRARDRGCAQVELYDDALRSGARERVRLASDLRRALAIAEGVETHEHAERLRVLGSPLAQGYMLARPLTAEAMGAALAEAGQARTALNEY